MSGPAAAILATWRERLWSAFVRLESWSDSADFYGSVTEIAPGAPNLSIVNSTAQVTERTAATVRGDPSEYLFLAFQRHGHGFAAQDDRRAETRPGQFVIYDTTRPYRLQFDAPFEQFVFRMPRFLLARRVPGLAHLTARPFDGSRGPGALVAGFVTQLANSAPELGPAQTEAFETAGAELIATALHLLGRGDAARNDVAFERVTSAIERHVMEPGLDLARLAHQQGMSLRSLQRLFHLRGTTPRAWLRERRLAGIASALRSPASAGRSITDIALAWGFNDLTHFNRAFRARYAVTPSQWRGGRGATGD